MKQTLHLTFVGVLLLYSTLLMSQSADFWSFPESEREFTPEESLLGKLPSSYQQVELDVSGLYQYLTDEINRVDGETPIQISLPTPEGNFSDFSLIPTKVVADEVSHLYTILTFRGQSAHSPLVRIRCDISSGGFHAVIFYNGNQTYIIEPQSKSSPETHLVYYKRDYPKSIFRCEVKSHGLIDKHELPPPTIRMMPSQKRTYRLAIIADPLYQAEFGGSPYDVQNILNSFASGVNLINEIYERDMGVSFELTSNTAMAEASGIDFTDVDEIHDFIVDELGVNGFDIGHSMVWANTGGAAYKGVVCNDNFKGGGFSGSNNSFVTLYVDYGTHEIGHQMGADHTFVSDECVTSVDNYRFEPGEGSSIMAYAGVCNAGYQNNSDPFLHSASIAQMHVYMAGNGSTCGVEDFTGNDNAPTANAMGNITIPRQTPFVLVGSGFDADGDPITFDWQQFDGDGTAQTGPPNCNSTDHPLFRIRIPQQDSYRIFPEMSFILTGNNNGATWEKLPCADRTMNFRLQVRDNNPFWGRTDFDDMTVTVADTGPFEVTEPNGGETLDVNIAQNVSWEVAGTDAHCNDVDILLTTDNGNTFTFLGTFANNGSASVDFPLILSTNARILIQCSIGGDFRSASTFFDVSDDVFTLTSGDTLVINLDTFDIWDPNTFPTILPWGIVWSLESDCIHFPGRFVWDFKDFPQDSQFVARVDLDIIHGCEAPPATPGIFFRMFVGDSIVAEDLPMHVMPPGDVTPETLELINPTCSPVDSVELCLCEPFLERLIVYTCCTPIAPDTQIVCLDSTLLDLDPLIHCNNGFFSGPGVTGDQFDPIEAGVGEHLIEYCEICEINQDTCCIEFIVKVCEVEILEMVADTACFEQADAMASVNAVSGCLPLMYSWSNGETTQTIEDIETGMYYVTVEDDNGCVAEDSIFVEECPEIVLIEIECDTVCFGESTGTATVSADGGCGVLTYEWSNGDIGQIATNLPGGTVTVIIRDENGCEFTAECEIFECDEIDLTVTCTPATCPTIGNGTAAASATGGCPPFTYLWNTGDTISSINGLIPGIYEVTVTDANQCTAVESCVVGGPPPLSVSVTCDIICPGAMNGTATANVSGGCQPYTYSWSNNDTTQTATNLGAGIITVVVTDASGATAVASCTVDECPIIDLNPICTAETAPGANDGTASANATGGCALLSYSWSNGGTTPDISGLAPGWYVVEVEDAFGCTMVDSCEVLPAGCPPTLAATVVCGMVCPGATDGTAIANPSGGCPPYTYLWSNGDMTQTATNLPAGLVTVTVTDNGGSSVVASCTVDEYPAMTLGVTCTPLSCPNSNDGTATANPAGGTPPYAYLWNTGDMAQTIVGLPPGTYSVTVTDANGCTQEGSCTVSAPPALSVGVTCSTICPGADNGTATATPSNGCPPYTYAWSDGQAGPVATGLSAGFIEVTVTDSEGVQVIGSCTVSEYPAMTLGVTCTPLSCPNSNDGTATANPAGGTPPYAYLWNTGEVTQTIVGLPPGTYTVVFTDANGCEQQGSCIVSAPPALSVGVTCSTICPGADNGTATATPSNGCPPYTYAWSDGQAGPVATGLSAGFIEVTVTDSEGVQVIGSCTVSEYSAMTLGVTCTPLSCPNSNDGTATANPAGGTPPYAYLWNTGDMAQTIVGLPPGNYTVVVTDANGCEQQGSCTVSAPPVLTAGVTCSTICPGANDGTATATANDGCPPYIFEWSDGQVGPVAVGLSAGPIEVTVTDSEGVESVATCTVDECPPIDLSAVCTPSSPGANNGSAIANTTGGCLPLSYLWSTGDSTSGISGLSPGIYTVTVTDGQGCVEIDSCEVTEVVFPPVTIAGEVYTEYGTTINEAFMNVTDILGNVILVDTTNMDGEYGFSLPWGSTATVTPEKDNNHLDGVTTQSAIRIQRHILFIDTLDSPYKIIAADINDDGVLSTSDLVELISVIVGILPEFLNNTSYRFIPEDYVFTNPLNPLLENWPEYKTYINITQDSLNEDWIAIKIGDVTGSTSGLRYVSGEVEFLAEVNRNEDGTMDIIFRPDGSLYLSGYQLELELDQSKLELIAIDAGQSSLPAFHNIHYHYVEEVGLLRTNWWHFEDVPLNEEDEFFRLRLRTTSDDVNWLSAIRLRLKGSLWDSEAYAGNGSQLLRPKLVWKDATPIADYKLYQNRPNPFTGETVIPFLLPESMEVILEVTDTDGRVVRRIVKSGRQGINEVLLQTSELSDGVYFYRVVTDEWSATKKMILMR